MLKYFAIDTPNMNKIQKKKKYIWQYERSNQTNCYGMQFFSERTFEIVHICDRVEIWTLMSKVVDEIEETVTVEKIDEKNMLDFKLAGEDELQCDFLCR